MKRKLEALQPDVQIFLYCSMAIVFAIFFAITTYLNSLVPNTTIARH